MSHPTEFFNLTPIPDDEAKDLIERLRRIVLRGERHRLERLERDQKNHRLYRNEIWTDRDLQMFEEFDMTPNEFPVQRSLINNLISRQSARPFKFDVVPTDVHSFRRFEKQKAEFIANNIQDFETEQEAGEYFDRYADDHYTEALSAMMQNFRYQSKGRYKESESFKQGLISGLDFMKCVYGNKFNRGGGVEIHRRPQRAMFYDENSVEYDMSDIEFIGEMHLLYASQLELQYPDFAEEIREAFNFYSTLDRTEYRKVEKDWKHFYDFSQYHQGDERVRVAEIWFLDTEPRFVVVDTEENERRIVEFGLEEEEIRNNLYEKTIVGLEEEAAVNPEIESLLLDENAEERVWEIVDQKYTIEITYEPIWHKAVFSFNALFEFQRSPLPHGSHPYYPYFPNFTEGEFRSLLDDIEDIIISINKALAFRELMMAHGAKGLVVVDRDALHRSGYSIEEVADHWSSVGGALALKLKPGQRVRDVFDSITTVGEGLEAINSILADLDRRLYQVSGVNLAQLGITERETTATGYRQQISEGEANNGLIFDNFFRTLEGFYNDKVVPLVAEFLKNHQSRVIRLLGEEHRPWLNINLSEDYNMFEQAVRKGEYSTVLVATSDNNQRNAERSSQYMEMAMAGILDIEVALEFSDDPQRYRLIKRNRQKMRERHREQIAHMYEEPLIQQIAMEMGLSPKATSEFIEKLQRQRMMEMAQQEREVEGEQRQRAAGRGNIQRAASETERMSEISRDPDANQQ